MTAPADVHRGAVDVRELTRPDDCHACADLYAEVWGLPPSESPMAGEVLIALAHSGNYVVGAYAPSGELIGGAAAWFGVDEPPTNDGAGARFLHSHIAAVVPTARGLGVGRALKEHQRRWCRSRGVAEIRWTFDPLVRHNAWFNLTRLGAVGVRYVEDYYGGLKDAINAGGATDRMVVHWAVGPPDDPEPEPAPASASAAGAYPVLDVGRGDEPVIVDPDPPDVDLAVWLPEDIVAMRGDDPDLAARWRLAQRTVLSPAMAKGYRAVDVSPEGWLRLSRPEPTNSRQ